MPLAGAKTWLLPLIAGPTVAAGFLTSHSSVRTFPWTAPTRSFSQALEDAFPEAKRGKHKLTKFNEGRPGAPLTQWDLIGWVEVDLLGSDPFAAHGGRVPLPWPTGDEYDNDQLGFGHYVAYTRRQLCYIVAKSFTGATTDGYANGLQRFLEKRGNGGCYPRTGDFGRGLMIFLETCYADPALVDGGQGPLVIVAKAVQPQSVDEVRQAAAGTPIARAGLRVCQYDDGAAPLGEGVTPVPADGCQPPSREGPGRDFMTGGLSGQATQDISAAFLGGYVFGNACGLGGGQDERLMTYMPEVAALTFFLSQHWQYPQLRQPAWILGARMLFTGLDGTARFNEQLTVRQDAPLTSDVRDVELGGGVYGVSSSRPFVAFQTENQGFYHGGEGRTRLARQNRLPAQRDVSPSSWFAFDKQVRAWYRSVALTSYNEAVRPAMKAIVSSIGTGPWLAGLWWGDSQLGFLAVWLGHAVAAPTWGESFPVDFYMYSAFTESPGSQCLVHGGDRCRACVQHCNDYPLPDTAFWMPGEAFFDGQSCVPTRPDVCGHSGIEEVVQAHAGMNVGELWSKVEERLRADSNVQHTVFDIVMDSTRGIGAPWQQQPATVLP